MTLGQNIKKYRTQKGLSQTDLSEKLNVTYQAVSRWENDQVEPSVDTLRKMSSIFECSIDDLLSVTDNNTPEETKQEEAPTVHYVYQETKAQLALCHDCNKPIYNTEDIHRMKVVTRHAGRGHAAETREDIVCTSCYNKRVKAAQEKMQREEDEYKASLRKRRIHSFIWPLIAVVTTTIIGIVLLNKGQHDAGLGLLIGGGLLYFWLSCVILNNNCVADVFFAIASWSIKLPGVIFTLDLNGLFFLIAVKVLGAILSFIVSALAIIFGFIISAAIGVFVYPFALGKNIKAVPDQLN